MLEEALDTGRITEDLLEILGKGQKHFQQVQCSLFCRHGFFLKTEQGLADKFDFILATQRNPSPPQGKPSIPGRRGPAVGLSRGSGACAQR